MADVGLLLVRAVLAAVFVVHGSQMLFGWFGGYGIEGTTSWRASVAIPVPFLSALTAGCVAMTGRVGGIREG